MRSASKYLWSIKRALYPLRKHRSLCGFIFLFIILLSIGYGLSISERRLVLRGSLEKNRERNEINSFYTKHSEINENKPVSNRDVSDGTRDFSLIMDSVGASNGREAMNEARNSKERVYRKRQPSKRPSPSARKPAEDSLSALANTTRTQRTTPAVKDIADSEATRCKEVRRLVSQGVVDYIHDFGDDELQALIVPIFTKKKLVVWSLDHHFAPVSDLRGIFEPLGVEFLEHTLYHNCEIMCTCDQLKSSPVFDATNIVYPDTETLRKFYFEAENDHEFQRSDAVLVTYTMALLQAYKRLKKSVILVDALRYENTMYWEESRWKEVTKYITKLANHRRHVVAANNLYDSRYLSYFTGTEPAIVQSFCAYTGAHYRPVRESYLYARRPNQPVDEFWNAPFDAHYAKLNATFRVYKLTELYEKYEYSDVAAHLGVVYLPYQVSLMSFFEQYTMGLPIFAPSLDFLVHLHGEHHLVYDRTIAYMQVLPGSYMPRHPSYGGPPNLDPNDDFSEESVRYWLSLSDFYQFPHVIYFSSVEQLVELLHSMAIDRLTHISNQMMQFNRHRLKHILRYWRGRLLDVAHYSPNHPH